VLVLGRAVACRGTELVVEESELAVLKKR
jgi:hypothetical protein